MNTTAASLTGTNFSDTEQRPRQRFPEWWREPLLHFVVLGGLLFAVDHYLVGRKDDPYNIVVGPDVDSEAVEEFEHARGHEPNATELKALHQVWLDNEVLYREGLAMQVDKGDDAIRQRVIFKELSIIDANVKLPPITDAGLQQWFEAHRDKYDEPARYDFEEAALSGDNSEAAVKTFVTQLTQGKQGDEQAGLRIFKGRPLNNLVQSYGADFPETLSKLPTGQWQAVNTKNGWRAIRLTDASPEKPAVFAEVRGIVLQDWKDATASEQRTAAVRALAKKYRIEFATHPEGSDE